MHAINISIYINSSYASNTCSSYIYINNIKTNKTLANQIKSEQKNQDTKKKAQKQNHLISIFNQTLVQNQAISVAYFVKCFSWLQLQPKQLLYPSHLRYAP